MNDSPPDSASAEKNQLIVEALREAFGPMTQRLTPEVEPATIYLPPIPAAENPE
jgi:hypothetical protein